MQLILALDSQTHRPCSLMKLDFHQVSARLWFHGRRNVHRHQCHQRQWNPTRCNPVFTNRQSIDDVTSNTFTGYKIQAVADSPNLKQITLELGGKSSAIVFEAADIERSAADAVSSLQMLMSQAFIAKGRIYVQDPITNKFKTSFKAMFQATKKRDPLPPETQQGPQGDGI